MHLKWHVVDGVEADQRREQPPVRFGQRVAEQETLLVEPLIELVERIEEGAERFLVGFLAGREAGLVDAVVDVLVDDRVDRIDLEAQRFRIEVERSVADRRRRRSSACG